MFKYTAHQRRVINDEAELVNKDDENNSDDKESGRQW